jgi:hypothetical protein
MAGMTRRLVDQLDPDRLETRQTSADFGRNLHGRILAPAMA